MVSFFGLKLGGDRKKSQDKKLASKQIQHLHRNDTNESTTSKDLRRLTNGSNFSRPNFARPGTSSSQLDPPSQWRAPYMGGGGGASSMVDLSAPRAPGMGNPRFHSSDMNLNTRFGNGSSTSLVAPGPMSAGAKHIPIEPARPGTAVSTREPPNPFNIHFGNDSVSSIPPTPVDEPISHAEPFEFHLGKEVIKDVRSKSPVPVINTGYPSPPPSIVNAERSFSPDNRPSSSRQNVPAATGLRNPGATGPMSLPSPAVSVARSEDVWESPVIRNVTAKRDTFTFHTPRRQSFAMETDDSKAREAQKPMTEGLTGNFAGFDFGDTVRKGSIGSRSVDTSTESGVSPTDTNVKSRVLGTTRTASPLRTMQSSPSLSMIDTALTRARTASDAMSPLSLVSSLASAAAEDTPRIKTPQPSQEPKPAQQTPRILQPGQLYEPLQAIRPVSPSRSPQPSPLSQPPQQHSPGPSPILSSFPGRAPSPPIEAQFPRSPPRSLKQTLQPSPQYPPKQYKAYQPPNSSPPTRPLPSPYKSPTAPLPPVPPPRLNPGSRSNTPDANRSESPCYFTKPLEPPPRGLRSRTGSDPRLGRPLRVPTPLTDRSATIPLVGSGPRSAVGTGFDESGFVRTQRIPEPPRTASPFSQRSPMEGDFPVQKGLPRGRTPQPFEAPSPERNFGLEPRKQRRQPPTYPPPRDAESPVPSLQQEDPLEAPGTPNWNDFDRAEAHKSAIPAALSPFRTQYARSPTQATDDSLSPRLAQYASSPISDTPPSLPSPSFPSLQKSISNSSENLARSFDLTFEGNYDHSPERNQARPLISPVMSNFAPAPRERSKTRVEAKRAPPRTALMTSSSGASPEPGRVKTPNPVVDAFNPGFI
ncbi:hypothetical protein FHETE_174 [Fusarium heterosporum]|uniref:Uncharacterized protein n=1 Tax=Fusarium heterosporum TaxID=42747 RepID=A0A8H5U138_FUSHE|nr:hypothetical protein FHETE_174 [Fusarium heterosporum]